MALDGVEAGTREVIGETADARGVGEVAGAREGVGMWGSLQCWCCWLPDRSSNGVKNYMI